MGAQLFVCGPMFTAEGGHGTEFIAIPAGDHARQREGAIGAHSQDARRGAPPGARIEGPGSRLHQGHSGSRLGRRHALRPSGPADGAVGGRGGQAQNLPLATHTGDARDVTDAVEIGTSSVEHGSWRDEIPDAVLERMAREGMYLDPTLAVARSYSQYFAGQGRCAEQLAGAAGGGGQDVEEHARFRDVGQRRGCRAVRHLQSGVGAGQSATCCVPGRRECRW